MKVYLAGHITGTSYGEATDWRNVASNFFNAQGVNPLSPMRGKQFLSRLKKIPNDARYGGKSPLGTAQGITGRDRNDVRTSDVVLMNLLGHDKISVGSMIEIGWADAWRIPVVLVVEPDSEVAKHVMVRRCTTYMVGDLDEGLHLTMMLLGVWT